MSKTKTSMSSQLQKFKEAAEKAECDQSNNSLEKAFGRLEPKQPPPDKQKKKPAK